MALDEPTIYIDMLPGSIALGVGPNFMFSVRASLPIRFLSLTAGLSLANEQVVLDEGIGSCVDSEGCFR